MTKTAQKIASIAEGLPPDEQATLLQVAETLANARLRFYDAMTYEQRTELEQSIAEADRGDVYSEAELDNEIEALLDKRA